VAACGTGVVKVATGRGEDSSAPVGEEGVKAARGTAPARGSAGNPGGLGAQEEQHHESLEILQKTWSAVL
jgi:hypothetical protein